MPISDKREWAQATYDYYVILVNADMDPEEFTTNVADLLTDLHHLADSVSPATWGTILNKAEVFYADEVDEEAGEFDPNEEGKHERS